MVTYEEFLEQNNVDSLHLLDFTNSDSIIYDENIEDSPSNYINVAKNADELSSVLVPEMQSGEYYKALDEFITNCNNNVKITHRYNGGSFKK